MKPTGFDKYTAKSWYEKLTKVVDSCKHPEQLAVAEVAIGIFYMRYPDRVGLLARLQQRVNQKKQLLDFQKRRVPFGWDCL